MQLKKFASQTAADRHPAWAEKVAMHQRKLQRTKKRRRISSVLRALDVLADPWSYLVLREAFFGVRRFDVFQRNLTIARNILTQRLERLVAARVLRRVLYQEGPRRYEYRLTDAGKDFYPAIVALTTWGDRWRPSLGGPPLELFHKDCGKPLHPHVVCKSCGEAVSPFDVTMIDGPGAGPERGPTLLRTRTSGSAPYLRGRPCSVARTLSVIGQRWAYRTLRESFFGVKRFEHLQTNLGIARNILSRQLVQLVKDGILSRRKYQDRPERYEYVLTPAAVDLYPALLLLMAWGDRWRRPNGGVPTLLKHRKCGKTLAPVLVCGACDEGIAVDRVSYKMRYSLK
jgi:DNA-binding HxlR family transcriptional regulator